MAQISRPKPPGSRSGGASSIAALGVFTRRMGELTQRYSHGEPQAACEIAELMRKAPGDTCTPEHFERFDAACRQPEWPHGAGP